MGRPALKRGDPARPHGVIRFQHRRKINCGSYSEHTCAHSRPHDPRKLLVIEGLELLKTRSCYEYHPPGLSKKVRTAMGRQIFTADADHASSACSPTGSPRSDAWIAEQNAPMTRPEAIRAMLDAVLVVVAKAPGEKRTGKASN